MSVNDDPLDPEQDQPSALDAQTHVEFQRLYEDASINIRFAKQHSINIRAKQHSINIRFAKQQQWRSVLYFSAFAIAVTTYSQWTRWADEKLSFYLLIVVWIFSLLSMLVLLSLQWWQGAEHNKIEYITSKWSSFTDAARRRKSRLVSEIQRYGMLAAMILYLELVTIAVTRIFWSQI